MIVVTAKQMKEIEKAALSYDLTMERLMENAGSAAAAFIRNTFPIRGINCIIFCGRGNNGGDGFVVARKLKENGANVVVVLVEGLPSTPQSKQMYESLSLFGIRAVELAKERERVEQFAKDADLIVDAIYGIGFQGVLTGQSLIACTIINSATASVVSLDSPSGVSSDRGIVSFGSVKADFTVAFQLLKPLHLLTHSMEHCGKVEIVEIGIPKEVYANIPSQFIHLNSEHVWQIIPARESSSHKGSYGRLLAICGSSNYRGAAMLSALGALRSGVGICVVAAPESVCSAIATALPEVILQPLPQLSNGEVDFDSSLPFLEEQLSKATSVLFGCGLGQSDFTSKALEMLLVKTQLPLVIDADGLNALAKKPSLLAGTKAEVVVTPHPGEMSRLMDMPTDKMQKDRISAALNFALDYNVVTVLKGSGTIIAAPNGRLMVNDTGNSGLATGGSGDLLAGIIASLAAQGIPVHSAAGAGVWLHGTAADLTAKRLSQTAMLPTDVAQDLSQIFLDAER